MMERKLIFDSALRLIREGRFLGSPMSEVAYYASLTEHTVSFFFADRYQLVSELASDVAGKIRSVVRCAEDECIPFRDLFFRNWFGLYHYYIKHPAVMAFVEQSGNLGTFAGEKLDEKKLLAPLTAFFQSAPDFIKASFHSENLALIFHGSVITAVKLQDPPTGHNNAETINRLPLVLWKGITGTDLSKTEQTSPLKTADSSTSIFG